MNATELELVTDLATAGERYSPEQYAATKTAEADLAAMRQPITPEALTAAGWQEDTGKFGGAEYHRTINANPYVAVWFSNETPTVAIIGMSRNTYAAGVSNMYDLRELARLLGGEG